MKKRKPEEEDWETASLEWIHLMRRERQAERAGKPVRPLSRQESEKLAKQFGLKLVRTTTAGR